MGIKKTTLIAFLLLNGSSDGWSELQLGSDPKDALDEKNLKFVTQCGETSTLSFNQECTTISHSRKYISNPALFKIVTDEIEERVAHLKVFLDSMDDGRISISPYDTAWVALVKDNQENGKPQFPSSLQWIAENQLADGSWGEADFFSAYDRLLNTLACVVALKSWNIHHEKSQKGISFINDNICKLELDCPEHMTIGFEVAFPSLIERAESMGIKISDDSPTLRVILAERQLKLARIPKELLHSKHTSLLFSLEGLQDLEWEKLLKLQSPDGSFLTSVSSTAFALMNTKNEKCLNFLTEVVEKFNGGAPHSYPIDVFAVNWAVDRLQRLGISRYFQPEIKKCLSQMYRYWMESPEIGLFSGRNSPFADLDDTAMVFRLLRLHGYNVSSDVFWNFKNGDDFQCFPLQSSESVTAIFSLYRVSQIRFPQEKILEEAFKFSYRHLRERQAKNNLNDKWVILKDLPGEVRYALDMPWFASLPRVEARFYIEQYGGSDEVWIGKTLYRMYEVSNNDYLELAKLDFNACQAQHRIEWNDIQKWYLENNLKEHGISRYDIQLAYFLAAASLFEPERSNERISWAKSAILVETIASYFKKEETSGNQKSDFIHEFRNNHRNVNCGKSYNYKTRKQGSLVDKFATTLKQISADTLRKHGRDVYEYLHQAWTTWLMNLNEGGANIHVTELLVLTINLCATHSMSTTTLTHPHYKRLSELTNRVCNQLYVHRNNKVQATDICSRESGNILLAEIEPDMQELVELVLQNSLDDGIEQNIKDTFLTVAKSFYYSAYSSSETISMHISKVLFEKVV